MPANATTAIRNGTFNKVPQLIGNTAEEGKLFSSAFKIDDYTRVKWMNGTYLGTASGLTLGDIVDSTIVSPLTVDSYNTYTYNNANHVNPAPSITTACSGTSPIRATRRTTRRCRCTPTTSSGTRSRRRGTTSTAHGTPEIWRSSSATSP